MKIYIFMLSVLWFVFYKHTGVVIWITTMSLFIPIRYAKDFLNKRLH